MTVEVKISFASVPDMLAFFANSKTLAARSTMEVAYEEAPLQNSVVELPAPSTEKRGRGRPPKVVASSTTAQSEVAEGNTDSSALVSLSSTSSTEGTAGKNVEDAPPVSGNGAAQQDASSTPVTLDEARAALTKLNAAKGLEEAKKALSNYGAARMADLKEGDYAAFIAYCQAASI